MTRGTHPASSLMNPHLARAQVLLDTHRPADAEREARAGLAGSPEDHELLHALCRALVRQKKLKAALEVAQNLVGQAPNWVDAHFLLCTVELEAGRYKLAERAAMEARRLAPQMAEARQNLAVCYLRQEYWHSALVEAEAGLALDPGNAACARILSVVHAKLGHQVESVDAAASALNLTPENASSQYVMGAAKLQSGDHRAALEHFTEALRLNPNDDHARAAVVAAMKAHNPFFRGLVAFGRFMEGGGRQLLTVAFLILYCLLNSQTGGDLFATGLYTLWMGFVLLAIISAPFFNAVLLLDRQGRRVLLPHQRATAIALIGCLVAALGWFLIGAFSHRVDPTWTVAILIYAAPRTQAFNDRHGWRRFAGFALAGATGVLLLASLYFDGHVQLDGFFLTMLILGGMAVAYIGMAIDR